MVGIVTLLLEHHPAVASLLLHGLELLGHCSTQLLHLLLARFKLLHHVVPLTFQFLNPLPKVSVEDRASTLQVERILSEVGQLVVTLVVLVRGRARYPMQRRLPPRILLIHHRNYLVLHTHCVVHAVSTKLSHRCMSDLLQTILDAVGVDCQLYWPPTEAKWLGINFDLNPCDMYSLLGHISPTVDRTLGIAVVA